MDFTRPETVLDLANIRAALIRMEDTILFDLIERAQFCESRQVYARGAFENLGDRSFLEWTLRETERMHSRLRRYEADDEIAFFPEALLPSLLPHLNAPSVLAPYHRDVSVNSEIWRFYIDEVVPLIAAGPGEQQENYGSCTLADIQVLQALSRRIHFGKFVAEAKFRQERAEMTKYIKARDADALARMITKPEVERAVLERVRDKAEKYGVDPHTSLRWSQKPQGKVDPDHVVQIYERLVIQLTKKVEVDYLLRRLEAE